MAHGKVISQKEKKKLEDITKDVQRLSGGGSGKENFDKKLKRLTKM